MSELPQSPETAAARVERRDPNRQQKVRGGRRASDQFLTVAEAAAILRLTTRTLWRKFLEPADQQRLLPYYRFGEEARIRIEDFEQFQRECFRDRVDNSTTKAS